MIKCCKIQRNNFMRSTKELFLFDELFIYSTKELFWFNELFIYSTKQSFSFNELCIYSIKQLFSFNELFIYLTKELPRFNKIFIYLTDELFLFNKPIQPIAYVFNDELIIFYMFNNVEISSLRNPRITNLMPKFSTWFLGSSSKFFHKNILLWRSKILPRKVSISWYSSRTNYLIIDSISQYN